MPAHWLVETGVFPDTAPGMVAALDAQGIAWHTYEDGMRESSLPPGDACVVFWGSLGAAYTERVAARWTPGAIGEPGHFACSAYYGQLESVLLNGEAVFTTVSDLVNSADDVLRPLGNPERVFVRPDSPLKPFSGRQLDVEELSLDALDHGFYYDDERLPIVVSKARRVGREFRFVIADREVIAGCEYEASRQGQGQDIPPDVQRLASSVASGGFEPAAVYVLDLCEAEGKPWVLELNPFSGADLYDCDADAVVAVVSEVAMRRHEAAMRTPS